MLGKIAHPRSKISGNEGGFKEFRIGDLFEIKKGKRLTKSDMKNGTINFIGATSTNNGITAKIANSEHLHPANTITVTYNGSVGEAFYQTKPFWASDDVNVLYPKFILTSSIALFFLSPFIRKGKKYGYAFKWKKEIMEKDFISLPSTRNGNIDFSYMEKYIEELQQQQHNKIETFLKNIGLNNCELTRKEKDCINGKNTVFEKITIGDLFDIHPTKAYRATNKDLFHIDGKIPVVANSSVDNGIGGWTKLNATETGNKIVFSDTTTSDSIFYQPNNFVGYPHVQGLYPYSNKWNENSLLYFVSCFRKSAFGRFNYGLKFTRAIAKQMNVILPTKPNGEINYDFMESFISAQKKLVAQKVVRWLEQQNINDNILKIEKNTPKQVLPMAADQKKKYTT